MIHSLFHSLEPEKQERIINAAMKEFAQRGYEKASTNQIVKEAQISKGSLFNYFRSKKDLYLYVIQCCLQIVEQIEKQIDENETDIFRRIEKLAIKKLQIQRKFPQVFDFLKSIVLEEAAEVKEEIQQTVDEIYAKGFQKLYQNIDYTKFREEVDVQKAIDILTWTMFGFADKMLQRLDTFEAVGEAGEQYLKEWKDYVQILRSGFYKGEEET